VLRGLSKVRLPPVIDALLETVRLGFDKDRVPLARSSGTRTRVEVAQAVVKPTGRRT
jgi:hypothetical protein